MIILYMIIVENIINFNIRNVFYGERVENNILPNSFFTKFNYSTPLFTTNGIILYFDISNINFVKNNNSIYFNVKTNAAIIQLINSIEEQLLRNSNVNKPVVYNLTKLLKSGTIKNINKTDKLILKMSGIWENSHSCGITYKII